MPTAFSVSVFILILSNLLPIIGVLFFHWSLANLLALYWMETGIIGFYNLLKMALSKNRDKQNTASSNALYKLFIIMFFITHFGGFMLGHGVFLSFIIAQISYPDPVIPLNLIYQVLPSILILFLSHGQSFVANYIIRKERERASLNTLFTHPYSRIVTMHITIILGTIIAAVFKQYIFILVILVMLKIATDVISHIKERRKFETEPTSTQASPITFSYKSRILNLPKRSSFTNLFSILFILFELLFILAFFVTLALILFRNIIPNLDKPIPFGRNQNVFQNLSNNSPQGSWESPEIIWKKYENQPGRYSLVYPDNVTLSLDQQIPENITLFLENRKTGLGVQILDIKGCDLFVKALTTESEFKEIILSDHSRFQKILESPPKEALLGGYQKIYFLYKADKCHMISTVDTPDKTNSQLFDKIISSFSE